VERRAVVVFIIALAACVLVAKPHVLSWNDRSRLATVESLADRGTFAIDGSPFAVGLGDEYRFRGRTYSDKSPLLALQGAAVATVLARAAHIAPTSARAIYAVVLGSVGVWFALGCTYAYAWQRRLGASRGFASLVAALSGVGTLSFSYATVLANHVPAGAAVLASLYHCARARERGLDALAGGAFAAAAFAFDAPAGLAVFGGIVLLRGAAPSRGAIAAAAFLPLVAAQLAFNHAVSGGFGPPAMDPASWADVRSAFHARAHQSLFFFDSAGAYARYAWYVLFGGKGLFAYTPMAALCVYGLARMWRRGGRERTVALAVAVIVLPYTMLVIGLTDDYAAGDFGERRFVDVTFALCVGLGPAIAAVRGATAILAARVAVGWSIATAALGSLAPFGGRPGEPGYAFGASEFVALSARAPLQAALDVAAVVVIVGLVLRAWSTSAAATRRAAAPGG